MWIIMPVLIIVFWGFVIWGIIALIRGAILRGGGSPGLLSRSFKC